MNYEIREMIIETEKEKPGFSDNLKKITDYILSIKDIYDAFEIYKRPAKECKSYTPKELIAKNFASFYNYLYYHTHNESWIVSAPPPVPAASLYVLCTCISHDVLGSLCEAYFGLAKRRSDNHVYHCNFDESSEYPKCLGGRERHNLDELITLFGNAINDYLNKSQKSAYTNLHVGGTEIRSHWKDGGGPEKKTLIDAIRNKSITDRIPRFFEWWNEFEKLLLSLPNKKTEAGDEADGRFLHYNTCGWYIPIKKENDVEPYTRRETTMALYAKLALNFKDYDINADFLRNVFLLGVADGSYFNFICDIPLYETALSSPYGRSEPELVERIRAARQNAIKDISEADLEYIYSGQLVCAVSKAILPYWKLTHTFDTLAIKMRRKINAPEECVRLVSKGMYHSDKTHNGDVLIIYENGSCVNVSGRVLKNVPKEKRKERAIELAQEDIGKSDTWEGELVVNSSYFNHSTTFYSDVTNDYGDCIAEAVAYVRDYICITMYFWASDLYYCNSDVETIEEYYKKDKKEKRIAEIVMFDTDAPEHDKN